MDFSALTKKLKTGFFASTAEWWTEFREWEQLCCPKRPTVRLVLLFLFFLLLELTVFVITLLYIPSRIETGSFLLDNGVPSILLIASIASIWMLSHMLSQRKSVGIIVSTLQHFDQTLQRLDFRLRADEVIYWTAGWILTFVITTILFSIAIQVFGGIVLNDVYAAVLIVFVNIVNIPYTFFTIWLMVCKLCVWYRLKLLHKLIDSSMGAIDAPERKERTKRSHTIAGLTELHSALTIVISHVNAVFGLQMTLSLTAFTMLLIFCLFSYYRAAMVMGDIEWYFARLIISWSLYNSCTHLPKILFGSWIVIAAKQLTILVHRYLRLTNDIVLQDQLEHLPLNVRSWFYTINWPVYASVGMQSLLDTQCFHSRELFTLQVIGYISTYVVILIQFDSKAMDVGKANLPNV